MRSIFWVSWATYQEGVQTEIGDPRVVVQAAEPQKVLERDGLDQLLNEHVLGAEVEQRAGEGNSTVAPRKVALKARKVVGLVAQIQLREHQRRKLMHLFGERHPLHTRKRIQGVCKETHDTDVEADRPPHVGVQHFDRDGGGGSALFVMLVHQGELFTNALCGIGKLALTMVLSLKIARWE